LRRDIYEIIRLSWRCLLADAEMRREVWRTVVDCAQHNPAALRSALRITALYIHLGPFARHAAAALERKIAEVDAAGPAAAMSATA
jgi:Zn-dependent oligopeptidase